MEGTDTENAIITDYLLINDVRKTENLTILSANVQSMNNKFQEIRDITHRLSPSILCLQETWGKNDSTDYSIKHYHQPHICTRPGSGMNQGGGVGIWISTNLDFKIMKSPFTAKQIETATIKIPDKKLLIINVYRPFGEIYSFIEELRDHIKQLREKNPFYQMAIVGDFNINLLSNDIFANALLDTLTFNGFIQLVSKPTRITESNQTLIDHVYTKVKGNSNTNVVMCGISDHEMTLTEIDTQVKPKKETVTKRWFTSHHYSQLAEYLQQSQWNHLHGMNAEQMAITLEAEIIKGLDKIVPIETKKVSIKKINQWFTPGIKVSVNEAHKLYKLGKRRRVMVEYKVYKKVLKKVIRLAKNMFYNNKLKEAGPDTRRIWSILNEVIDRKQCRKKIPGSFKMGGKTVTNKKEIANAFNDYFASIGKEMADAQPNVPGFDEYLKITEARFQLEPMVEADVMEIMKLQQPKLSCGLDSINNRVVKTCHEELAKPMTMIINQTIQEGYVPSIYKKARIIPLYKKGASDCCGNYRPVSLLPALSKIVEKAICRQLMTYLSDNDLLCHNQHGFRARNQTTHVVHSMLNTITENATQDKVTIATYIDLSKAFDCLQYNQLFTKMKALGFQERTLNWFISYLTDRTQITDLEGELSSTKPVNLGVPQGSILGPILFLIYVNDMNHSDTTTNFIKFADDTTILSDGPDLESAVTKMNNSLEKVGLWFQRNKLNLNPSKTRYMIFNSKTQLTETVKIKSEYIERVWEKGKEKCFKLVGINIDENLKWTHHINGITKKINSSLYALTKASKTLNVKNKKLIYSGLIHSHIVYGLPIWGFATKGRIQPIFTKQKLAIRKIHNLPYREHTKFYFLKSEILQLPELIQHITLCYMKTGLTGPSNVRALWTQNTIERENRRHEYMLVYTHTNKQWIHNLAPIAQAKLWNQKIAAGMHTDVPTSSFKRESRLNYLLSYKDELKSQGYDVDHMFEQPA